MALETAMDDRPQDASKGSGDEGAPASRDVHSAAEAGSIESVLLGELCERYSELRLSCPGVVAAVRRSIEREGLLHPLVVNLERDGKLAVLDGFKRLRALRDLDRKRATVRVLQLEETNARVAVMTYNASHRGLCELEQAWVVRSLVKGCRLRQTDVAELLGRHKSWVCRRLALCTHLEDVLQQDMRLGLLGATMARELARLPRGNQAPVAAAIREHHLSCRQAAKLVNHALRCRDARGLDVLLKNPWPQLVDRAASEPSHDARLGEAAEALRRRLLGLAHAAGWWQESLQQHPLTGLSSDELHVLGELAVTTRDRCAQAISKLDPLLAEVAA